MKAGILAYFMLCGDFPINQILSSTGDVCIAFHDRLEIRVCFLTLKDLKQKRLM